MKNTCFLIVAIVLFFTRSVSAQIGFTDPIQNILNENFVMFNPAFFSEDYTFKVHLNKREWVSESPIYAESAVAFIDWTPNEGGTHLGLSRMYYGFDAFYSNAYGFHASKTFKASEHLEMAVGARLNWMRNTWDPTANLIVDPDDPLLTKNSVNHLDGDIGLWFQGKKLYGGLALKHLLSPDVSAFFDNVSYSGADLFQPTLYVNLGYEVALGDWSVEPRVHFEDIISTKLNHDNVSSANVLLGYKEKYYLGFGRWFSHNGGTTTVMAKVQVKKRLGLYLSYAGGTHFNRERTRTHLECGINFAFWNRSSQE